MKDRLIKKTALYSVGFFTVSMCAILYLSMNKTIEISDVAQDEVAMIRENDAANLGINGGNGINVGGVKFLKGEAEVRRTGSDTGEADGNINSESENSEDRNENLSDESEQNQTEMLNLLKFSDENMGADYLAIPLPDGIVPENIAIENHYMDSKLCISLADVKPEFFETNELSGNHNEITVGNYEQTQKGTVLNFKMKGIYEYKTVYENGQLYVSYLKPHEVYDKIVVIDPAYGGTVAGNESGDFCEKDIALSIAKKLKDILDSTDIKAYYTRMDDVNPSEEGRIKLANETKADAYIRIGVDADADQYVYGVTTKYNDEYFIPGFGNVDLADALEYEVVSAIKGKALGLVKSTADDYTLKESTVPSASISVGYITNPQEIQLLTRDDYVEKIATGIYNAILRIEE